jgi:hypothetical protein
MFGDRTLVGVQQYKIDKVGRICLGKDINYSGPVEMVGAYNRLVLRLPKNNNE